MGFGRLTWAMGIQMTAMTYISALNATALLVVRCHRISMVHIKSEVRVGGFNGPRTRHCSEDNIQTFRFVFLVT